MRGDAMKRQKKYRAKIITFSSLEPSEKLFYSVFAKLEAWNSYTRSVDHYYASG
jgi:hypothetical protein